MADPIYRLRSNERAMYLEPGDLLYTDEGEYRPVAKVTPTNVRVGLGETDFEEAVLVSFVNGRHPLQLDPGGRCVWLRPDVPPGEPDE